MDEELKSIKEEILKIKERLRAIEKEQRLIREDILTGEPHLHMKKRILEKPIDKNKIREKKYENIDIKI
jgi:septation ring formation regulator EzrA